jgi:hypothetical protein
MKVGRIVMSLGCSVAAALAIASTSPVRALAQGPHSHPAASPVAEDKTAPSALVKAVREATARFQNVAVAEAEGYTLQFGCVTGGESGAMGLHYVKGPLVADGELDVMNPEIILYEPTPNGPKLVGADYLVLADAWNAKHAATPQLMGQLFHFFEAPNRFGLPPFYTLHVWAWKDSPTGAFVNWHTGLKCDAFKG